MTTGNDVTSLPIHAYNIRLVMVNKDVWLAIVARATYAAV